MNCSNPIADLEKRKWEILKELECFKNKILNDLSGVDKETLADLRKMFDSYKTNVERKFEELSKSFSSSFATFTQKIQTETEQNLSSFKKSFQEETKREITNIFSLYAQGIFEQTREKLIIENSKILMNVCNPLKGGANGTVVCLNDVSPLEHEMSVKLTGVGVDLSTVNLTKYGLNVFNQETVFSTNGFKKQSDGSWLCNMVNNRIYSPTANRKIYIRGRAKSTGKSVYSPLRVQARFTDNTWETIYELSSSTTEWVDLIGETHKEGFANKTIDYIRFSFGGSTPTNATHYLKDLILSYADAPYEPYVEPTTYTTEENGNVSGVTSLYPFTTLLTDTAGIVIEAEYNRDINKAFENLINGGETANISLTETETTFENLINGGESINTPLTDTEKSVENL